MSHPTFGSQWTVEKLTVVEEYLKTYRTIFTRNENARYFTTHYIDAFASTGYWQRKVRDKPLDKESTQFVAGSAIKALELDEPFDRYHFIDKDPSALGQLETSVPDRLRNRVALIPGDANEKLRDLISSIHWKSNRAVAFLDPYGLQVNWETLRAIADTKAIDMWLLFSLGAGVNRMLTRGRIPDETWCKRLDLIFGDSSWRERFYEQSQSLFPGIQLTTKIANHDTIAEFMLERLGTIFTKVCKDYLVLRNSKNSPMFILVFAAGNDKGAPTAIRIARDIIKQLGST